MSEVAQRESAHEASVQELSQRTQDLDARVLAWEQSTADRLEKQDNVRVDILCQF